MERISRDEYERLTAGATVLSRDGLGDKVLMTPDGTMYKLFRRKRLVSSAAIVPYARRFERAARLLAARGIPTVEVTRVFSIGSPRRDVVVYQPLEGDVLRERLGVAGSPGELVPRLAVFLALLHERRVYFRAIHFGNVIVRPDGSLGLIDVSEARFRARSLSARLRARNFKHLLPYPEDVAALTAYGVDRFLEDYLAAASLRPAIEHVVLDATARTHPLLAEAVTALHDRRRAAMATAVQGTS